MYHIYEIASERKVGVTDNIERRLKQHIAKYGVSPREFSILESHTDIYKVSERELEIQAEKGYPVDKQPYWYMVEVMQKIAATKEVRKKAAASTDHRAIMSHLQRAVIAIDKATGIETWYSGMGEAAKQLTDKTKIVFSRRAIGDVCNPKQIKAKSHKGYIFKYADSK